MWFLASPTCHLEFLVLAHDEVNDEGAQLLSEVLLLNKCLKSLLLKHAHEGNTGSLFISIQLKYNESLLFLDLECNNMDESVGKDFLSSLRQTME